MHCAQLPASGKVGAASMPPGWGCGGCAVAAGWHAACGDAACVWPATPGCLLLPGCFCWPPPPPPRKPAFIVGGLCDAWCWIRNAGSSYFRSLFFSLSSLIPTPCLEHHTAYLCRHNTYWWLSPTPSCAPAAFDLPLLLLRRHCGMHDCHTSPAVCLWHDHLSAKSDPSTSPRRHSWTTAAAAKSPHPNSSSK